MTTLNSFDIDADILEFEKELLCDLLFRQRDKLLRTQTRKIISDVEHTITNGKLKLDTKLEFKDDRVQDETTELDKALPKQFQTKASFKQKTENFAEKESYEKESSDGIMNSTSTKLLVARVNNLTSQLDTLLQRSKKAESASMAFEQRAKEMEEENTKLQKLNQSQQSTIEKLKNQVTISKEEKERVGEELLSLKRENESLSKSMKQLESQLKSKDIKINKYLDDSQKLKDQLAAMKNEYESRVEIAEEKTKQEHVERKCMEGEKTNLMNIIKKQAQLIEILKKQKIHLEECLKNKDQ